MGYPFCSTRCCCALLMVILLVGCGGGSSKSGGGSSLPANESSVASSTQSSKAISSSSNSTSGEFGLATRPSNTNCVAPEPVGSGTATTSWPAAFPSLPAIARPVGLFQLPDDNTHWYFMSQTGVILRFDNQANASSTSKVLDIEDRVNDSGNETGLLGVAVHPNFNAMRYVFLYYTGTSSQGNLESRVARYTVGNDGVFDRNSELILLRITRPYSNHVGGQMAFGSDGYLYIASGDGGSGGDPHEYGQNKNVLLGKILRIDVNTASQGLNYGIPTDNPFVGQANTRAEIWAYGLRNPWRFSFDRPTGTLWVGDVGQGAWEEINQVTAGGNYGWGDMEGNSCYSGRPNCSASGKIKPVHVEGHDSGVCSITGGYVYRGTAFPSAYGKYFFTDYCVSDVKSLSGPSFTVAGEGSIPAQVVSFAEDNQGELYAIGQSSQKGNQIFKMQASGGQQPGVMADHLSATGCVQPATPTQPAAGLIPYKVISQLWSDGATKERYLALPNGAGIDVATDGDFGLPVGSVLVKHFKLNNKFVETRLFAHGQLGWQGFSYEWLDDQSDAVLLSDGKDKMVSGLNWHYPSRSECFICHTRAADFALGVEARQLNSKFIYPSTGINANQLSTLEHIGLFSNPLSIEQKTAKLTAMDDTSATLDTRARSYLHSNCSGCHRPDGPTTSTLDLRYQTSLTNTQACNQPPVAGSLGIANAQLIAPGEPARSVLLARMNRRDANQMPPLATHLVDTEAVQVVSDWIASLQDCGH